MTTFFTVIFFPISILIKFLTQCHSQVNIARWSVTEVCDFIKKLPGCSDYVEDFMVQEIDGQALMLLQADHLMSAMSIKLGPALKICEQVDINLQTYDVLIPNKKHFR